MLKSTRRLLWASYWLSAVLLSLLALLVLMLRIVLPQAENWTESVEQQLAQQLDAEVEIHSIAGVWQGVFPTLQIDQLHIVQSNSWTLRLRKAEVGLNLSQSLLQWRPVFTRLRLEQPLISITLPETSAVKQESASSSGGFELPAIPVWLLDQPLEITDGQVEVRQEADVAATLRDINIGLTAMKNTWQLAMSGQLGRDGEFRTVRGIVEGQGAPHRGTVWFYGELDGIAPGMLNGFMPEQLLLDSVNLKHQLWARAQRGRLLELKSLTDIRSLQIGDHWSLEDSQFRFDLQPDGRGYQWQMRNSQLTLNDAQLWLPTVAGNLQKGQQGWFLKDVKLPELALERLTEFVRKQPLPDEVLEVVSDLNLRGHIRNLLVQWPEPHWNAFQLVADLDAVDMDAWDDVPQILGINGRLEVGAKGGKIHLNSQDFTLNFPTLFPQGWRYQQADGVVGWRIDNESATIYSELLHLKEPAIEANGRFSLMLPFDGGQTELTLMIGTRGADGTVAGQYVPPEEVGKATHSWLVDAIRAGSVKQGAFLLNGGTRSRLDDYQLPAIQMYFDVTDAEFAFQPGWPAVKNGDAFMLYKDGALSVDITEGQLLNSKLKRSWVGLTANAGRVDVIGGLDGDAKDLKTLLTESPLQELVGDGLDDWMLSGSLSTDLQLAIPLEKGKPEVHISSNLDETRLHSKAQGLSFNKISGVIRYDTPWGLSADKLTAQLFGHPATATIVSEPVKEFGNRVRTQIKLDSRIKIDQLKDWLKVPVLNIASGETWYRARLNLCQGEAPGCSGLDVRSSLQGVEIVGPEVVAKASDEQRYLRLTSDLGNPREQIGLRYGDQIYGQFLLVDQSLERGRISFGRAPATLPPEPGLRVVGSVDLLDLSALEVLLERAGLMEQASTSSSRRSNDSLLHSIALSIARFRVGDTELKGLDAIVKPVSSGWQLDVASETVTGKALFPADGSPYDIHIAQLNLKRDPDAPEGAGTVESVIDPEQLPRANVVVQQLLLNDKPMGAWSFVMEPDRKGATLRNIQGNLADIELQGEIRWDGLERHQSALTLKISGGDMGDVLERWGHGRVLENQTVKAYLQMDWPGPPWAFRVGAASGESRFIVKKGRLVDTGAASNFLRIFGILNLDALGRRLRLDFSDLFEKGVAFDRIGADYLLKSGVIHTRKPFEMTGLLLR